MTYDVMTTPKMEIEFSIAWMRNNPELAGKSLENFLTENAEAKKITFNTYPGEGFLTVSAYK